MNTCADTASKMRNPLQELLTAKQILLEQYPQLQESTSNGFSAPQIIEQAVNYLESLANNLSSITDTQPVTQLIEPFSNLSLINSDKLSPVLLLEKLNILVVDDNAINRTCLKTILSNQLHHNVTTVTNGQEAVDLVCGDLTQEFNLIFMDIDMPKLDGIEATKLIRKQFNSNLLPIVACTSHSTKEELKKFEEAGMNDIIVKPATLEKIKNMLHKLNLMPISNDPLPKPAPLQMLKRSLNSWNTSSQQSMDNMLYPRNLSDNPLKSNISKPKRSLS